MVLSKKSEKNKKEKVMSELGLPDEVVISSIIPLLSMKEVARSSLVSHSWLRYWRNTPILTFQDPSGLYTTMLKAFEDFSTYSHVVSDARRSFILWVNNVLTKHIGCTVEEFKVAYYLNNIHQVNVDWWVVWAFSKHVQRLVLDFTPPPATHGCNDEEKHYYVLDRTLIVKSFKVPKLYLTTLCLKSVNVDTLTVNYLLDACCSTLDNLCIVESQYLTTIITAAELPSLKYFMVVDCPKLEIIDIKAPKLVSLTYNSGWDPILRVLNIGNASKLSYANIIVRNEEHFLFILRSLFKYFPHLEHLRLDWITNLTMDLVLGNFPVLANLKHLEMFPKETGDRTLAAWVPFIGACPRLEKLTLGIRGWLLAVPPKNVYQKKWPLRCLKTFEIRSFHGKNLDVDIANFVVHNGINLQEVIIHHTRNPLRALNTEAPFADVDFELPPDVKVVIVK